MNIINSIMGIFFSENMGSCVEFLKNEYFLTEKEIATLSTLFSVEVGSIVEQEGVIQDPAGSAVGGALVGGGLSGAIYQKFQGKLNPIEWMPEGKSQMNSTSDLDGKRILHTHSPHLGSLKGEKQVVEILAQAYKEAILLYLEKGGEHKQTTLNLCAISASIYGAHFAKQGPGGNHIDPKLTISSLVLALREITKDSTEMLQSHKIKVFYFSGASSVVADRAIMCKEELNQL